MKAHECGPQADRIFTFSNTELKDVPAKQLAPRIICSSARLCAMFTNIADQLERRDEKSVVFANNPWEVQLYTVLL